MVEGPGREKGKMIDESKEKEGKNTYGRGKRILEKKTDKGTP